VSSREGGLLRRSPLPHGSCRWTTEAVHKARIIAPVTRATIVLIEVGSCGRALWTRPKPTTSVTQASASITTFSCVWRLAASSEKLFITPSPKTSLSLVGASRRKVQPLAPIAQMDLTHSVNGSASMHTRRRAGPLIAATRGRGRERSGVAPDRGLLGDHQRGSLGRR
jgi:hypothetical protein